MNLGGGFHHCSCTRGGGFCPIADISIALKFMRAVHGLRRIMIVDLVLSYQHACVCVRGCLCARVGVCVSVQCVFSLL